MKTIFKYRIHVQDEVTELPLPFGSKVRHVGVQDGDIYLWIEETTVRPVDMTTREFKVVGTGHPFGSYLEHVGTVQVGIFVWHVMERV